MLLEKEKYSMEWVSTTRSEAAEKEKTAIELGYQELVCFVKETYSACKLGGATFSRTSKGF